MMPGFGFRSAHTAILAFPGQGSQRPGMCKDLAQSFPAARYVLEEVDDALQMFLSRTMFDGSAEELRYTEITQPALFAHSMATLAVLRKEIDVSPRSGSVIQYSSLLGHSVGEFAAMAAYSEAATTAIAQLLRLRGRAMQEAGRLMGDDICMMALTADPRRVKYAASGSGGQSFVDVVQDTCAQVRGSNRSTPLRGVWAANLNSPAQVVISGTRACVQQAADHLREHKWARRATELEVSAPFHTPAMRSASFVLAAAMRAWPAGPGARAYAAGQDGAGSEPGNPAVSGLLGPWEGGPGEGALSGEERAAVLRVIEGAHAEGWAGRLHLDPESLQGTEAWTPDNLRRRGVDLALGPQLYLSMEAPLISNVTAQPVTQPVELAELAVLQAVAPVRFSECLETALGLVGGYVADTATGSEKEGEKEGEGEPRQEVLFLELGSGGVCGALAQQTIRFSSKYQRWPDVRVVQLGDSDKGMAEFLREFR